MRSKLTSVFCLAGAISLGASNIAPAYIAPLKGTLKEQAIFESELLRYRMARAVLAFDPENRNANIAMIYAEYNLRSNPVSEGLNMDLILYSSGCLPGKGTGLFSGGCHAIRPEKDKSDSLKKPGLMPKA